MTKDSVGNTSDLMLALGRYDAFLASRYVEAYGGDPNEVLEKVMSARELQLEKNLGRLRYGGWWPNFIDDMNVMPVVGTNDEVNNAGN